LIVPGANKTTLIIGAGLVGANYAKRVINSGKNVIATVSELDREQGVFERRTFPDGLPERTEINFAGKRAVHYGSHNQSVILTPLNLFEEEIAPILTAGGDTIDTIVNAVNLGTIFGIRALQKEVSELQLFRFCHDYHVALVNYARQSGNRIRHLLVSTTGSGGIVI